MFQVFGLGNKTYEHYNKVAIYVDKRLEELGANRVFELGLGDDDAKYAFLQIFGRGQKIQLVSFLPQH